MRKAENKDRLLRAGLEEFSRMGFFGAKMERIAKKAQVNKAMIFYYFKSKKGFYLKLLEKIFEDLRKELEPRLKQSSTPRELITSIVDVYFSVFSSNPEYVQLFSSLHISENKIFSEPLDFFERYKDCLTSNIKRLLPFKEEVILNLLLNLMGMIFFTFLGRPLYKKAFAPYFKKVDESEFFSARKEEIIKVILLYIEKIQKEGERV